MTFLQSLFFFRSTVHNMFQTRHNCTYDCIGTSGKNCQNPNEGVLVKTTTESI